MDDILHTCHNAWISILSQCQRIAEEEYLDPKNTKKYQNYDNDILEIPSLEKDNPINTSKILKQ